jgi:flagellar basal-body rod modification protein FlgD
MEITPTNQTLNAAAAAKTKAEITTPEKSANALAGDFETFLKLLTAQMQNQDPLEPTNNTEWVAQLASFSSVEQQIRTNDQLGQIFGALGGNSPAGLSNWIGKEVRAATAATFAGVPVNVDAKPADGADKAVLVVSNDFGQVVAERAVDPAKSTFSWDGRDALGNELPNGSYAFKLQSYKNDEMIGETEGEIYAKVNEVVIEDGVANLILDSGQKVSATEVSGLR